MLLESLRVYSTSTITKFKSNIYPARDCWTLPCRSQTIVVSLLLVTNPLPLHDTKWPLLRQLAVCQFVCLNARLSDNIYSSTYYDHYVIFLFRYSNNNNNHSVFNLNQAPSEPSKVNWSPYVGVCCEYFYTNIPTLAFQ